MTRGGSGSAPKIGSAGTGRLVWACSEGSAAARAAGEGGTAAFVETAGAVLALVAVLPLVRAVAQLMGELLG